MNGNPRRGGGKQAMSDSVEQEPAQGRAMCFPLSGASATRTNQRRGNWRLGWFAERFWRRWYDRPLIKIIPGPRLILVFFVYIIPNRLLIPPQVAPSLFSISSAPAAKVPSPPPSYTPNMTITISNGASASSQDFQLPPRPKDVGILAMEMYFPRRVRVSRADLPFDAS